MWEQKVKYSFLDFDIKSSIAPCILHPEKLAKPKHEINSTQCSNSEEGAVKRP